MTNDIDMLRLQTPNNMVEDTMRIRNWYSLDYQVVFITSVVWRWPTKLDIYDLVLQFQVYYKIVAVETSYLNLHLHTPLQVVYLFQQEK